jgi:hypothetical protein
MNTESEIEREPETKKRDSIENLVIEYDEWAARHNVSFCLSLLVGER